MKPSINPEKDGIIISEYCNGTYYFLEFDDHGAVVGSFIDGDMAPTVRKFESVYDAFLHFMVLTDDREV